MPAHHLDETPPLHLDDLVPVSLLDVDLCPDLGSITRARSSSLELGLRLPT